jgi:hypothetical protein
MAESKKRRRRRRKKSSLDFYGLVIKLIGAVSTTALLLIAISATWQFLQNPFMVVGTFINDTPKSHTKTWKSYESLFVSNKTTHLSPTFLAALAQTESSGRQWTTSEWIFSLERGPMKILAPVSTSFGLMQFTSPTFEIAKNYCVNKTKVESAKPWYMLDGCWFNFLKTRGSASDSIETTAAYLQNYINENIVRKKKLTSNRNAQRFAAIAHLCGVGVAKKFVRNNFYLGRKKKCGSHDVSRYLRTVFKNKRVFDRVSSSLYAKNQKSGKDSIY